MELFIDDDKDDDDDEGGDQLSSPPLGSLAPLYLSAKVLWLLIGCSSLGVLLAFCRLHLGVDVVRQISAAL